MFTYYINQNISLKFPELKDADRIFQLTDRSREYLREWLPWVDFTKTVENSRKFIQISRQDYIDQKSMVTFIVWKGKVVGVAGFNQIDWPNKSVQIGYWLDKNYEGKGIMTKSVEALTDYAFNQLSINRVEIKAAVNNKKSRAIPERLGFVKEGIMQQAEWINDRFEDIVVYGKIAGLA